MCPFLAFRDSARFEVTTAVLLNTQVFCDVIMCCRGSDILLGMLNPCRLRHCAPSECQTTILATQSQIPDDQNLLQIHWLNVYMVRQAGTNTTPGYCTVLSILLD